MVLTMNESVTTNNNNSSRKGGKNTSTRSKHNSSSSIELNNSFSKLNADPPTPCKICDILVENQKAIGCDKCLKWFHSDCTDLTNDQYKFLSRKNTPTSIKWFCPSCVDADNAQQNETVHTNSNLERIENLVLQVTKQNAEILQVMSREKMVEERIKVNVSEILEDQRERVDRKNNLILYNVPEGEEGGDNKSDDSDLANSVLKAVCPDMPSIDNTQIKRMGDRRKPTSTNPTPRPRPIKITLSENETRDRILRQARKLKDSKFKTIGISADKTKKEREHDLSIRREFLRRKNDEGEDVVLYKGEIYNRSEAPWRSKKRPEDTRTKEPDQDEFSED